MAEMQSTKYTGYHAFYKSVAVSSFMMYLFIVEELRNTRLDFILVFVLRFKTLQINTYKHDHVYIREHVVLKQRLNTRY